MSACRAMLTSSLAASGSFLISSSACDVGLEEGVDNVRVLLEELRAHDHVRGDELTTWPQILLVDQDLRAFGDVLGHVRLGHPGPVDLAGDVTRPGPRSWTAERW